MGNVNSLGSSQNRWVHACVRTFVSSLYIAHCPPEETAANEGPMVVHPFEECRRHVPNLCGLIISLGSNGVH